MNKTSHFLHATALKSPCIRRGPQHKTDSKRRDTILIGTLHAKLSTTGPPYVHKHTKCSANNKAPPALTNPYVHSAEEGTICATQGKCATYLHPLHCLQGLCHMPRPKGMHSRHQKHATPTHLGSILGRICSLSSLLNQDGKFESWLNCSSLHGS